MKNNLCKLRIFFFILILCIEAVSPSSTIKSEGKTMYNSFLVFLIQTSATILNEQKKENEEKRLKNWRKNAKERWSIPIDYSSKKSIYKEYVFPLAKIIFAEAGNMPDSHQQNVGYVVMNRVNSNYYPNTIKEVFFTGNAYAKTSKIRFRNNEVTKQCIKNAKVVINNYFRGTIPVSPALTFQAEFKQGVVWKKMGNTYFGYDPRILEDLKN